MLGRLQGKAASKAYGQVCVTRNQVEWLADLKDPTEFKRCYFKVNDKVMLDTLFDADELTGKASLHTDPRLTADHINLGIWFIKRDHSGAENLEKVCLLDPKNNSQLMYEIHNAKDPNQSVDSLVQGVADMRAQLAGVEKIGIPVWGGSGDGDLHWTLVSFTKKDDQWELEYRDSLSLGHADCREMAKKILVMVSMALDINKDLAIPPRCNTAMQKPGGGDCGLFVIHWMSQIVRQFLGEGSSAGYPNEEFWKDRLDSAITCLAKNKGVAKMQAKKAEEDLKRRVEEIEQQKALSEKIVSTLSRQREVEKMASTQILGSFSVGGCSKCKLPFGSTCCNPAKIEAKTRAEEEMQEKSKGAAVEGSYDKKRYEEILEEIHIRIIKERTGKIAELPKKDKKAGGDFVPVPEQ